MVSLNPWLYHKVGNLETKNCWCMNWQEGCVLLSIISKKNHAIVTRLGAFFFNLRNCMQSFFLFVAPAIIGNFGTEAKKNLSSKHSFGVASRL